MVGALVAELCVLQWLPPITFTMLTSAHFLPVESCYCTCPRLHLRRTHAIDCAPSSAGAHCCSRCARLQCRTHFVPVLHSSCCRRALASLAT